MTLTLKQQQALAELVAHLPHETGELRNNPGETPDLLQTLIGLSSADLKGQLLTWLGRKDGLEQEMLTAVERNPLEASLQFLTLTSLAFFLAEKDHNPKVRTVVDAFYFITTCASVGYADVFPVTETGRAIASIVMTVGPALTAKALDRPSR